VDHPRAILRDAVNSVCKPARKSLFCATTLSVTRVEIMRRGDGLELTKPAPDVMRIAELADPGLKDGGITRRKAAQDNVVSMAADPPKEAPLNDRPRSVMD
jgi:hypothetical protein